MATIHVDGRSYEVDPARNLLDACLSLGFDLPYFCWHPALGSVGACRLCAVKQFKDEHDTRGRIVMSCMTPADDGTRISIADPEAARFRKAVIEWLMLNHPHDCPVCDEGGECHLQDMTVMTGHAYRATRFRKRTFVNQYLGPLLNHEMNRCIECYRCVRFYRDYAGGEDLDVFGAHDHVYFGRRRDGVLESEFAGNLAEVCPTGVFTDKTLGRHYVRKWDQQMAPSVCPHCSGGCNIFPAERYGVLRRVINRYNGEVNGYFLCDRGRFGYGFVNDPQRIRAPRRRGEPGPLPDAGEAVRQAAALLRDPSRAIGIGSPRASLESNFALRALVGPERFFAGYAAGTHRLILRALRMLRESPAPPLREVEQADAVLVLGEDIAATSPRTALALRQSVRRRPMRRVAALKIPLWHDTAVRDVIQGERGPLFVATPFPTRIDAIAARTARAEPSDLARIGFAAAHAIQAASPAVPGLSEADGALAEEIARALLEAERPLVVTGIGCASEEVLAAAEAVARALRGAGKRAGLLVALAECNDLGLALLAPRPIEDAFEAARSGQARTVFVLENDLHRRAGAVEVSGFASASPRLVVLDHLDTETARAAELFLPAAAFAESEGTYVSHEGRAQRFFQVLPSAGEVRPSWRWLAEIAAAAGHENRWSTLDDVIAALAAEFPALAPVRDAAPPSTLRVVGRKIPRAMPRYTGRTAMHADRTIHEPPPPSDPDAPLAFTMEGTAAFAPSAVIPWFWAPQWNSPQAVNKFQDEIAGPLRGGDPGVRLFDRAASAAAAGAGEASREPATADDPGEGHPVTPETAFAPARIPDPFRAREGELKILPVHHVFGSEETSARSAAIAELAPAPYLLLGSEDALRLGLAEGAAALLRVPGQEWRLPVRVLEGVPRGVAGAPAGLVPGLSLPAWGRVERA